MLIEAGIARISTIQDDARGAVEAIRQIGAVINQINDISNTIASAVEEQTATTNEIAQNITAVAQAANTTEGAGNTHKAATELARMATELQQLAGQFQYEGPSDGKRSSSFGTPEGARFAATPHTHPAWSNGKTPALAGS